ncbi:hypothetical protein [Flavobacterium sp.]|uniref:hypothetical protein n=1 Tax=Flavobacterium sp. TaxID=239 RepID=UPI003750B415
MKVHTKKGIDKLLFGMKQKDVELLYGKPNKHYKDDDKNIIYLYNLEKLRLTFYEDEDFRLGYIISSNSKLELFESTIIGKDIKTIKNNLIEKGIKSWEVEDFDSTQNHFNEPNWIILQSEFDEVIKLEIGAIINDKDEFDWKFNA